MSSVMIAPHSNVHADEAQSVSQSRPLDSMRILFVLPSLELGGAERQALLLARYLAEEQRARVQVWGLGAPGRVATLCEEAGLPWRSIPVPPAGARLQQLKSLLQFVWTLRKARPEVILPYTAAPNVFCGLVWRWTGARQCVWNQRNKGESRMALRLERWAVQKTSHFVANSHHGREFLMDAFGLASNRVLVIPNGIQLAAPQANRAEWRQKLELPEDEFTACMVANLTARKDHATLLKAWRKALDSLESQGKSATLLLAGYQGDTHEALLRQAQELQLGKTARFLGQVQDIPGLLSAIDLGILSSQGEGNPNGVLECMAAGLPVVGTDIPGIREAVGPEGYPHLAPIEDADTLADRILEMAINPTLRAEAGNRSRDRIEREFTPRSMCEKMVHLMRRS